ncbi:MAG: glutamyl-tRNA reductase [Chloroflexi bacterium]|nr:glutamyl-tRNA reductase [Chloroflexota bacterium]
MKITLVGINHQTAPIEVLERAAIRKDELDRYLQLLGSYVPNGIILSTCNRTEVYTVSSDGREAEKDIFSFFCTCFNFSDAELTPSTYVITQPGIVAEHLFRIAGGLDSLIIGEYEVLGQVGHALQAAEKAGMVSLPLRHLFQSAIRTGRRVREETGISKNALSVSSVAVDLATRIAGDMSTCRMLVIGAGEAGRLVAKAARDYGTPRIVVANRTQERASALAMMLGGTAVELSHVPQVLSSCNIVVACAEAPQWILDVPQVEQAMKERPELPLVIIDIAVPRNVEPAVKQVNNVFLYNMDDLTGISEANRKQREEETALAAEIIRAELDKLTAWWQALQIRPAVSALMEKAEAVRTAQLNKTLKKLRSLSQEERDYLEAMTKSIVVKILKDPIEYLEHNNGSREDSIEMVSRIFHLKKGKSE